MPETGQESVGGVGHGNRRTGRRSLLCYTRRPTSRQEANNADVALSMHLALRSPLDGSWQPLHENYGIFFAAGVPVVGVSQEARAACTASSLFPAEPAPSQADNAGLDAHSTASKGDQSSQEPQVSDAVAKGAVMPGVDIALKSLKDPWLFRLADGRFGIVATRTEREGKPDGSEQKSCLLAVSADLLSYQRLGQLSFASAQGVVRPRVLWDRAQETYLIFFNDDSGCLRCAQCDDIEAAAGTTLPQVEPQEGLDPYRDFSDVDYDIADAVPGNEITISQEETDRLCQRFGRIYHTDTSVQPVHLPSSCKDEADLRQLLADTQAELTYSDTSTARRKLDWSEAQVQALASDLASGSVQPGSTRSLQASVRQQIYPVPFAQERADPSIFPFSWQGQRLFMFIATEDADGNCVDPRGGHTHMPLRVADSIGALSDLARGRVQEIDLLTRGDKNSLGQSMTGCFWAPELHIIGGRLSILFMPCFDGPELNPDGSPNDRAGKPDMWTGSCHIMQLKQDASGQDLDPRQPDNWQDPRPILRSDGGPLNPVQRISLDMTVFQDSGNWYYAWQQVGSVWIATFDPDRPDCLSSQPRQIIVPEFAWDNMIAEGPNAIVHDGRISLIYSGSLVGIDYTTGLVSAPADQGLDLSDPKVWSKLDYPLQKSGLYNGSWQLGTGHGMWSQDEDGNLIYVFHNAEYVNGRYGGRDAQVRRVHWSADGMPILDMQTEEELDPTKRRVAVEVILS